MDISKLYTNAFSTIDVFNAQSAILTLAGIPILCYRIFMLPPTALAPGYPANKRPSIQQAFKHASQRVARPGVAVAPAARSALPVLIPHPALSSACHIRLQPPRSSLAKQLPVGRVPVPGGSERLPGSAGSRFPRNREPEDCRLQRAESSTSRGVLGEDFLEHFHLLIENVHKLLCLDSSGAMRVDVRGRISRWFLPRRSQAPPHCLT
jgi:hypothetical protein